jgi:hypothetical protein
MWLLFFVGIVCLMIVTAYLLTLLASAFSSAPPRFLPEREETSIPLRPSFVGICGLYGGKKCSSGPCDCTGYDDDDY